MPRVRPKHGVKGVVTIHENFERNPALLSSTRVFLEADQGAQEVL